MARQRGKTFGQSVPVCPGTPLTFSFPELTHRGRVEMEAGGIKLEEYRLPVTSGVESLGFSIGW
jgi:hypothetical protein